MNKINFSTAVRNLKKNFLLLFSTGAALCLFLSPSITSLVMTGGVFVAVCVAASYDLTKPKKAKWRFTTVCAVMIALLIGYMGYDTFHTTWTPSSKVAALANAMGITTPILLSIVGLLGCIVGFYSLWVLGQWITNISCSVLKEKLPEQRKDVIVKNFKSNFLFFLSGGAFLIYSAPGNTYQLVIWLAGALFALLLYGIVTTQIPSIMAYLKKESIGWKAFYFITTTGICWSSHIYFYKVWSKSSKLQTLSSLLPVQIDIVYFIGVAISIASFLFLYVWITAFWRFLRKHITQMNLFSDFSKTELIVYVLIFFALCVLAIFAFTQSEAFYGTEINYDIVYTSDSTEQVRDGVYTSFWHSHNEIKQPMFTLFASPFSGAVFLIGKILGLSAVWRALLINLSQIALLMCSAFILAKILHLTSRKRACFVLLFFGSYTALLSVIMMEQFIVSLFWLLLVLYDIAEEKQTNPFLLVASGGVVVTNLVCTPLLSNHVFTRNYKAWIKDMCHYACYFVVIWIGCGRITTLLNFTSGVGNQLSTFGGAEIPFYERLYQYTTFIKNYFLTPEAGPGNLAQFGCTWPSWQLAPVTGMNVLGVVIFVLALLSVWVNRDKRSSVLAGGWILFSVLALCILGWGSAENGMILYSLYFGWPFLTLLFQLVEKIENKLRVRFVLPAASIICVTASLICNIPALHEMIEFISSIYPC